ncbi:hypothetical protein BFN67_17700 [Pseudaminobacter manganicus]|uniref:Uncharacterized protein n=1 Tax=Manganibacter manganicus TaxID=1873176 RepID=A0A1V8RR00_9HYPH|nr:hypothetical protein BFN67_17700 [Pseudaminobacter manganicus]
MSADPFITIGDMRRIYCVRGVKRAFADMELDFPAFLRHGIRASAIRGRGYDAMLDRVLDSMRSHDGR